MAVSTACIIPKLMLKHQHKPVQMACVLNYQHFLHLLRLGHLVWLINLSAQLCVHFRFPFCTVLLQWYLIFFLNIVLDYQNLKIYQWNISTPVYTKEYTANFLKTHRYVKTTKEKKYTLIGCLKFDDAGVHRNFIDDS